MSPPCVAHDQVDEHALWTSNVDGTRNIVEACRAHRVPKLVFTSTNCLWASNLGHEVREDEPPNPIEPYGCLEARRRGKLLHQYEHDLRDRHHSLPHHHRQRPPRPARCILLRNSFRTAKSVGGRRRLQSIPIHLRPGPRHRLPADPRILAERRRPATSAPRTLLLHFQQKVYEAVDRSGGHRRQGPRPSPKPRAIAAMRSSPTSSESCPLGPYHYRMIAEDAIADTTRIRQRLQPGAPPPPHQSADDD